MSEATIILTVILAGGIIILAARQISRRRDYLMRKRYGSAVRSYIVHPEYPEDKLVRKRALFHERMLTETQNKAFIEGNIRILVFFYEPNKVVEKIIKTKKRLSGPGIISQVVFANSFERFLEIVDEESEKEKARTIEDMARANNDTYITRHQRQQS